MADQDQQWLVECLNATLDTNHQVRSFAEASLNQASLQPGFGSALCKVAANGELPVGLRQLASVLLKHFIKKHWHEDDDSFEPPVVSSEEKLCLYFSYLADRLSSLSSIDPSCLYSFNLEVIRRFLLSSLNNSHRKISTAISMALASIAQYDWPVDWPDFMPCMIQMLNDPTKIDGGQVEKLKIDGSLSIFIMPFMVKMLNDATKIGWVHGALRCLALLSEDIDDKVVPTLVPVLFPCLLSIVSAFQIYDKSLRGKALSIVYSCTLMLSTMSGVYRDETTALMSTLIKPWMTQFAIIMQHPLQSEEPDDWSLRMEVLKCLNQFVQNFPTVIEKEFMVIMAPLWQTFVSSLKLYELSAIKGDEDSFEGRYDSDGTERSLESYVIQLLEFFLTIVGSRRFVKVVENNLQELAYYIFGFLQMTEQQVHSWSLDANQYVADEDDDSYSCRICGILILEEIVSSCGEAGVEAIIDAGSRRFNESQQEKAEGSKCWWRIREALIYALASLSAEVAEMEVSGSSRVRLKNLIEHIVTEDIETGVHKYPFLHARLFSSMSKISFMIKHEVTQNCLSDAMNAIRMDVPPPVKVGACRALSQLLPGAKKEIIQPNMMNIFSSLVELLKQASEETLHLVLESLQAAIKSGGEATAAVEPVISPIILNEWASHVSDPFISVDAVEVLEAIKNAPGCIGPLVSRILPYIGPILSNPKHQPEGLVAGSLDLITMLLKNSPSDIMKSLYDVCFNSLVRIVLQSDDHSEMQNATECLAAFVSGGRQELLGWGADPGFTMKSLLDALSRLLDPNLESSGSFFVGKYVLMLILHLPSQMMQHIHELVAALVRRMQSCEIAGLKNSLLHVFARLVHASSPEICQFIGLLVTIPAEGYDNAFTYVMTEWVKQQGEIQGAYQIKVTTTALALLLSTKHVLLGNINVPGHLIESHAGIMTRSKAKAAPEQWTAVPLNVKMFSLLADTLIEIQEQVTNADDVDSDWEEVGAVDLETDLYDATKSFDKPTYEQLAEMGNVYDENQKDDDEVDLLGGSDPLNEINLAKYLIEFLSNLVQSDSAFFEYLYQSLSQPQQKAVQNVLGH